MSRAFRNFLIGYLLLHLLATGVFVWGLSRTVRSLMIDNAKQQMNAMAIMLGEHINELEKGIRAPSLPQHLKQLGRKTQFRYTLIDDQGNVVVDSDTGTKDIGFHGDRPEILAATIDRVGFAERYSSTLKIPMMYLAVPVSPAIENEPVGHIRVATPAVPINSAIRSVQTYFWLFAITLSLLTSFLMALIASYIMKPLSIFADAAKQVGVGQYDSFPALLNRNDEWRSLADAFRNMQSELANREQRIIHNRDRLQAVLSSMIEGVVAIGPQHSVLIANRAARQILGVKEELVGRNLLEVVRNSELSAAVEKTQNERTFSKTDFQTAADTSRRTISARVSVLPSAANVDEEVPGVVIVLNDITELRQLETMRRDFVANVSHELKTPLASIKAYAETLRLGALNDESRNVQFVQQIESQADFLNQQIIDLLQLARLESGSEVWDITPVDLNEACEKCSSRFSELAQNSGISLVLQPSNEHPKARADVEGLATMLNNLVANALNYTPAGGSVFVSTSYQGDSAVIDVTDTGIGISSEHHARIFERFYRVDKARLRDKGGTGLGLAIVKHLAQSFGGGVELDSELGKGTTFRIRLPKFVE